MYSSLNKHNIKVSPTVNTRQWVLLEDIEYGGVKVPAGFTFDGASIPLLLRGVFPHGGRKFFASCIHDYCYVTCCVSKSQADKLFLNALLDNGVGKFKANIMYYSVSTFGRGSYNVRKRLS